MIDYNGKVVIVTGSTRGIGRQIAESLAVLGAKIVISSRKAEDCQRVQAEFEAKGYTCLGVAADVSSMDDCKALSTAALEAFGQVDVLVNNAGITLDNLMMRMKENQWDDIMNINLKSVFNMSQALLRNFSIFSSCSPGYCEAMAGVSNAVTGGGSVSAIGIGSSDAATGGLRRAGRRNIPPADRPAIVATMVVRRTGNEAVTVRRPSLASIAARRSVATKPAFGYRCSGSRRTARPQIAATG